MPKPVVVFFLCLVFLLPMVSTIPVSASPGINKQLNFQGKVTNSNGTNVTNGSYSFTFNLYSVASDGSSIWTETKSITVTDGIFQTALGSVTSLPGSVDFNTDNIYLGINFNSDGEMSPRLQFTAVPYAFNSDRVGGLASTALVTNTSTTNQTITSTQTTGSVLGVTDTTGLTAALTGLSITLSGTGAFDQTGLSFNLSGATGTNLNDIVGSGGTWKVSRTGALTVSSCTGCGAGGGGGVSLGPGTADSVSTNNTALWINSTGTGALLKLQKSGSDKFQVANSGALTITGSTTNLVKTTTGTTAATDFSLAGSTLTAVTSANDLLAINDGSVTNTMSTSTVVTTAAVGAGAHTILREDGQYIIIHGNSLATGSLWDGSSPTMSSVTVATGAVNPGAGSIALKRPDGRYLIVHGNASAGLTSLFDPRGITAIAAGPAVCGGGAATTGTTAFLRPDGKYVILCGGLTAWGIYNPTANTYTAGTAVATAFGAGAHTIQRDDGTFLIFRGGNTTSHWIYNPFASATGTMTADLITANAPTITTGAFSIRRADGKYLVLGGAINTSSLYDPTRTTAANSGAGTMTAQSGVGFGPTTALSDGAQILWRQDNKYLLLTGSGTTTNVIDPSKTDSTQFTAGPALNAAAAAGIHAFMRPDGAYHLIRGGATTTTDVYNSGFIIGGAGSGNQLASYETECMSSSSLNPTSTLRWTGNSEGRIWLQVKTGTGSCSGSYKDVLTSGDSINPTASDNRIQVKVFFQRDLPKFADQEWGIRRAGLARYRRVNKDPALYDLTIDNSTSFHRSQFEFGNSSDPSGPVMVNLTNNSDRNLAIALEMGVGYGTTINASNPEFYNGAFGTHPTLPVTATAGTIIMRRPDGKLLVIAGNATANAQVYDPSTQLFTAQSGAGNIPTAGTGLGGLAVKRPDGKYLVVIGNSTTTTNIYDPLAAAGSQFVAGPVLTATAGRGALVIPLPNGRILIMHGNFTASSSIYDPFQNTMVAGPTSSAVIGGGSLAIPRPNGTYFVVLGIATEACTALNTTTNNFDPYSMTFTATGSPAITTGVGPGAFAFGRSDGQWVIVHGGGTITTCAGTNRTQIYNPITNKAVVGPTLSAVAQHGAHAIPKPDGTWLVVHGGALTTTSTYLEKAGAFTADGVSNIGQFIAGPALVTAASAGAISFQRPDGKFVTLTGNATTTVQQYDGGWVANGIYRSEALNVPDLDSSSALVWQSNADLTSISAEIRTATSKDNLQTATFREIPTSGSLVNPQASETWVNVNFNFKRTFPSYSGVYSDTWYNGGSPIVFTQRKIIIPTLNEFKITKDIDLLNLKTDGLSVFRVNSGGDIYTSSYGSVNTGGADLAERYTSQVSLDKGEVVAIDPQNNHGVRRTTYQSQPDILGVVSTLPGFVAGSYTKDSYPIALVGRVPVKVTSENGPIYIGDHLTSASVPGHATKAIFAGRVLGTALENLDLSSLTDCPESDIILPNRKCGTIMMFVNLTNFTGAPIELVMHNLGTPALGTTQDKQQHILSFLQKIKDDNDSLSKSQSEILADRIAAGEIISPQIITNLLLAKTIRADHIEGLDILAGRLVATASANFKLPSFFDSLVKFADVMFLGRPTFNKDTGGLALINKDTDWVQVTFSEEYTQLPIVVASPNIETLYAITDVTSTGFKIKLSKTAPESILFRWTALAIKDAATFESILPSPSPSPTPLPTSTPEVAGTSSAILVATDSATMATDSAGIQ